MIFHSCKPGGKKGKRKRPTVERFAPPFRLTTQERTAHLYICNLLPTHTYSHALLPVSGSYIRGLPLVRSSLCLPSSIIQSWFLSLGLGPWQNPRQTDKLCRPLCPPQKPPPTPNASPERTRRSSQAWRLQVFYNLSCLIFYWPFMAQQMVFLYFRGDGIIVKKISIEPG